MLYNILHKLFKWDYIAWNNGVDQGVARVHISGTGEPWYWQYKLTKVAKVIDYSKDVLWLTCPPEKYFTPSVVSSRIASVQAAIVEQSKQAYSRPSK